MGGTGEEEAEAGVEEEDAELRVEMLAAVPRLKRLNKGVVTPEERYNFNYQLDNFDVKFEVHLYNDLTHIVPKVMFAGLILIWDSYI